MEMLIDALKTVGPPQDSSFLENDVIQEEEVFLSFYNNFKKDSLEMTDPTYKTIPQFYYPVPEESNLLRIKLREEARSVFLDKKGENIPDEEELKVLWNNLDLYHTSCNIMDELLISYDNLQPAIEAASKKFRNYVSPSGFAKLLQNDPHSRVAITDFFNYIMRKVWIRQTRIGLSAYDVTGQGYLKDTDLENYIMDLIPTLPKLNGLKESFHKFYACTATRKFSFFLDPLRTGKIRIQDILACSFLDDLLELRNDTQQKDKRQDENWFSAPSALRVYGNYLNLDKDQNGMLSKEELAAYQNGSLTSVFLDRVFQECLTFTKEMDYRTYLDFVLALENRKEPQSLQYLFRILDIKGEGYLDTFTLNYFFKGMQEQMKANEQELVSFQNIRDEMFDMVKPKDPARIYLRDLLHSGKGDTLISILIDMDGFWNYENREASVPEDSSDDPAEI